MLGACVEPTVALATCERGRARNLDDDGSCLTTRDTRDLARAVGVYVDENDTIECEAKTDELLASLRLQKVGCIAREAPSPPLVLPDGGTRDIAAWSRAAASEACRRLLRSPFVLSTPEPKLTVELSASVPNNDLTLGFVRLRTQPPVGEDDLSRAARPIDDALRRLGGTASASDVSSTATCVASTRRPISVP